MHRLTKTAVSILGAAGLIFGVAACDPDGGTATQKESKSQQSSYSKLVAKEPAHSMSYSPTRQTINFWVDTWSKPGKLSYVYLMNSNGKTIGYYVLKGLPVSYCAMLTPTYKYEDRPNDESDTKYAQPAPGMDGAYYSGNQCDSYYGKDATTGAYIEYTAGLGINVLLYDQPLPNQADAKPLGPTSIADVKG